MGGRQAKVNEKRQCFKGWETLVIKNSKETTKKKVVKVCQSCSFFKLNR